MHLSKSDFKLFLDCPQKLYYKKKGDFDSNSESNEFLLHLADDGYIIGKYAQVLYPNGIEIQGSYEQSISETSRLLKEHEHIVLFEAAVKAGDKIVRVDILEKKGNVLNIIEVKSSGFDSSEAGAQLKQDHLVDITFQKIVLREAFPKSIIHCYIFRPDKACQSQIDNLPALFPIRETTVSKGGFRNVMVDVLANDDELNLLRQSPLLALVNVDGEVENNEEEVKVKIESAIQMLNPKLTTPNSPIGIHCLGCEYRNDSHPEQSGFHLCWGPKALLDQSGLSVYQFTRNNNEDGIQHMQHMINVGKMGLCDINPEWFKNKKGQLGTYGHRQMVQRDNMLAQTEWTSPEFKSVLNAWQYPLHFIDFETYRGALPFHKGMRPHANIAFQWSVHTIKSPGVEPEHFEYLNEEKSFPNFRFAEKLMECIGDEGTPFMWSHHENTVLKDIYNQLLEANRYLPGYSNDKLLKWLQRIVKFVKDDGRLVDMCAFTRAHYFHPEMGKSNSIKYVLPAVWNDNNALHTIPWFSDYYRTDVDGNTLNPYDTLKHKYHEQYLQDLKELESDDELSGVIQDGTAAMFAYKKLLYGEDGAKLEIKQQLLNYCELDTLAMMMIWEHWKSL